MLGHFLVHAKPNRVTYWFTHAAAEAGVSPPGGGPDSALTCYNKAIVRILALLCDEFRYTLERATIAVSADSGQAGFSEVRKHCLVMMVCVEPGDAEKVSRGLKSLRRAFQGSGASSVVLNAFAHLGSELASPDVSEAVISRLADGLAQRDIPVHVTPFGWYKSFQMSVSATAGAQRFIGV